MTDQRTLRRRVWLSVHSWLGLTAGVLWAVIGLTGAALVFYVEIEYATQTGGGSFSAPGAGAYQTALDSLHDAFPDYRDGWRLEAPLTPGRPITARFMAPKERRHHPFAPLMVDLDPASGQIVATRQWGHTPMTWIYDLHYQMLADEIGGYVLAGLGMLTLAILASGLVLWWPRGGGWGKALSWRVRHGPVRRIYDWHRLTALGSVLVVAVLSLTGALMEIPVWVTPAVHWLAPMPPTPSHRSVAASGPDISADQAAGIAIAQFPKARLRWIETPTSPYGAFSVRLSQAGEPGLRFGQTRVWIDRHSGTVLDCLDPARLPAPHRLLHWLHPLHNGEALGLTGRLIALAAGFAPAILLITGWLRHRQIKTARQRTHPGHRHS